MVDLSQRGLKLAAKWAAEMLTGLDLPPSVETATVDDGPRVSV